MATFSEKKPTTTEAAAEAANDTYEEVAAAEEADFSESRYLEQFEPHLHAEKLKYLQEVIKFHKDLGQGPLTLATATMQAACFERAKTSKRKQTD